MHSRAGPAIAAALMSGRFFGFYGDSSGRARYTYRGGIRRRGGMYPYSSKRQQARTTRFAAKMAVRGRDPTGQKLAGA